MSFIEVRDLCKTYTVRKKRPGSLLRDKETVEALRGVSFDVERGELLGLIGPNGAGKSTAVKILSGILMPDSGTVTVGGRVPWANRKDHVRRVGVVFGQRSQLWWDVPVEDSFSMLRDIYRIPEADYRGRLKELTEALRMEDLLRTPLRLLSLGQRMRAELCGSLLHRPELLFLDEPTIGLDAVSTLAFRAFLQWENRRSGTTVLLTTHDTEDIAALCARVLVLGHGSKLFDGELGELLRRFETGRTVTVRYESELPVQAFPPQVSVTRVGPQYHIAYRPAEMPTASLISLLQERGAIRELTLEPENIEHLIAAMYREMDL